VATSLFAEQYALYGVAAASGAVPAAKAVGCLASVGAFATVLLMFIIVLLFPDGRLPSRRWRPVLWATVVVFIGWGTQQFQAGTIVTGGLTNALQAGRATYPNPVGFLPRHRWYSDLLAVIFILAVLTLIAVVASVFARRRGASPERRQQLAWLGYVGALSVIWILSLGLVNWLASGLANDGGSGPFGTHGPGARPRLYLAGRTLTAGLTTDSTQGWISGSPLPGRCPAARRSVAFRS
jgi:hypothetical protein